MARKRAFTLLETLFALGITMLLILNFTTLLKGISKIRFPKNQNDLAYAIITITEEVNMACKEKAIELKKIEKGEAIIITGGFPSKETQHTNLLRVEVVD